jgi:polygalacturonase
MPTPPLCLLAAAVLLLLPPPAGAQETCSGAAPAPPRRGAWMSVASFGAVGDGRTLNTAAFARAVARIERRRGTRGGTLLYVPPGVWLTGPFNLTSHMTLFLARGAVIRATQVGRFSSSACPWSLASSSSLGRPYLAVAPTSSPTS